MTGSSFWNAKRDAHFLQLVAEGKTTIQIGDLMGTSAGTIMRKFRSTGVRSAAAIERDAKTRRRLETMRAKRAQEMPEAVPPLPEAEKADPVQRPPSPDRPEVIESLAGHHRMMPVSTADPGVSMVVCIPDRPEVSIPEGAGTSPLAPTKQPHDGPKADAVGNGPSCRPGDSERVSAEHAPELSDLTPERGVRSDGSGLCVDPVPEASERPFDTARAATLSDLPDVASEEAVDDEDGMGSTAPAGRPHSGVTILRLTNHTCRWPLWRHGESPKTHQAFYCGALANYELGEPYCPVHTKLMGAPPRQRPEYLRRITVTAQGIR